MTKMVSSPNGKTLHHVSTKKTTHHKDKTPKKIRVRNNTKTRLAENRGYLKNQNVKAFISAISEAEGGDYDLMYGGVKGKKKDKWRITDFSTHPGPGIDGKTTAAGRYQINKANWQENGIKKMGLTDFTPETQDLIAVESLRQVHAVDDVIAGDIPTAVKKASATWSALPRGPGLANSSGQPYMEYSEFVTAYKNNGGIVK